MPRLYWLQKIEYFNRTWIHLIPACAEIRYFSGYYSYGSQIFSGKLVNASEPPRRRYASASLARQQTERSCEFHRKAQYQNQRTWLKASPFPERSSVDEMPTNLQGQKNFRQTSGRKIGLLENLRKKTPLIRKTLIFHNHGVQFGFSERKMY